MRGLSLALLWGGAGLALVASGQSWWTAGSATATGTTVTSGAALVLVLAGLAGAFLSGFLRPVARRVVTGLVIVLFAGGVAVALTATAPATLAGSTLNDATVAATPWRWFYVGALLLAGVGALLSLAAKPGGRRPAATPDPALDAWKALDAGQDPTEVTERGVGGEASSEPQQ